ncbi:hypothetical protein V6N12_050773 [Hibiscus sabdariffa]|uniref:Uncharacterized protein n=1 Tax=Hibiscus sabdariffa TaxID=183260 RepID=A0ABR2GDE1_9ROSI
MPPRRETHFGVGVPVEDQNVDAGLVQPDGLPPHPPIPLAGRGAAVARANVREPAPAVVVNPRLPLELERC